MRYAQIYNGRRTAQHQPIPGTKQIVNSAGGYTRALDDSSALRRFLIPGTEGGSYNASEQKLTAQNAEAAHRCIPADGARMVREIVSVSEAGRDPQNDRPGRPDA